MLKSIKRFDLRKIKKYIGNIPFYKTIIQYDQDIEKATRQGLEYGVVKGTNETYLFYLRDETIPRAMFLLKKTYSEMEMRKFIKLTKKEYGLSRFGKEDIFVDAGANIGTTSIFFAKNIFPEMTYLAFEPDKLNHKILTINAMLNDCANVVPEQTGLSDEKKKAVMKINETNRGNNKLCREEYDTSGQYEYVETVAFDEYMENKGIKDEQVKMIWMDVEGHEPYVILGMKKLLSRKRIPLFMELTPDLVEKKEIIRMLEVLSVKYRKYYIVEERAPMPSVSYDLNDTEPLFSIDQKCNVFFA